VEIAQITTESETAPDQTETELNPLEEARAIAAENASLEREIAAPGGIRERRLRSRQRSYGLGCYYHAHLDKYQEFAALPYFDNMHKKPHQTNIMWSVMNHSMQAKGDAPTLQRVSKWAIVFEEFHSEGIHPDDCITALKARGGMDYIYEQISALKKARRQEPSDVVDYSSDGHSVQTNPVAPNTFAADDNASVPAESGASGDAVACSIAMHGVPQADDEVQELSANAARTDHGQHSPVGEAAIANRYDKKGPLNRIDLETEVAILLSPDDLGAILNSAAGVIRYSVIRRDGCGWVHIAGGIKQIFAHDDFRSASTPTSESDGVADLRASTPDESATEAVACEPTIQGARASDNAGQTAQQTASLATPDQGDQAIPSPRRIGENGTSRSTSPAANRVLSAQTSIVPASGAVSAPKGEAIGASMSRTIVRERADTIRRGAAVAEWPRELEALPDLSVPLPTRSSKSKPRQRR